MYIPNSIGRIIAKSNMAETENRLFYSNCICSREAAMGAQDIDFKSSGCRTAIEHHDPLYFADLILGKIKAQIIVSGPARKVVNNRKPQVVRK